MSENQIRMICRKPGNSNCGKSPIIKRSTQCIQNKQKVQKSPIKHKNSRNIAFDVDNISKINRKHTSTQTTCIAEPDSTSLSFIEKSAKKNNKNECITDSYINHLTWFDLLQKQNISKSENKNLISENDSAGINNKDNASQIVYALCKLVNTLHDRVMKTGNDEMMGLISNIRHLLKNVAVVGNEINIHPKSDRVLQSKFEQENNEKSKIKRITDDYSNYQRNTNNTVKQDSNLQQDKRHQERPLDELHADVMKNDDLSEIKSNIVSINNKMDEYKKNFSDFQKLILRSHNAEKNIDKMKIERGQLEKDIVALVHENKRLKKELKAVQEENVIVANEIKLKNEEIAAWKKQILKMRYIISENRNKSNFMSKTGISISSIIPADDTERPVSSSPLDVSFFNEQLVSEGNKIGSNNFIRSEENDSGIQSNSPAGNYVKNDPNCDKNELVKNSFRHILTDLKEKLQIKVADNPNFKYSSVATEPDASICLSEATYKYSMPS